MLKGTILTSILYERKPLPFYQPSEKRKERKENRLDKNTILLDVSKIM